MTHEHPLPRPQAEEKPNADKPVTPPPTTPPPDSSPGVSVLDQLATMTQSFAIEIHASNLESTLDEYLDVDTLTMTFDDLNPNPKGSSWTDVDGALITVTDVEFDFAHAVQICLTMGGTIFGPSTDAQASFIDDASGDNPVWVGIEKLRGNTAFYAYSQSHPLPLTLLGKQVKYSITGDPKCVALNLTSMEFKTTDCGTDYRIACTTPDAPYRLYQDRLFIQNFFLTTLTDLSQWYEDLGGSSLLSIDDLPVSTCRHSIPVFSKSYPPLDDLPFPSLTWTLSRFTSKFNWIQKLLHGLKLLRSHRVLSALGFSLSATPEDTLCIAWKFPVFPAWTKSLFSFSITDICLASATVSVAILSACLTCRAFSHDRHRHHREHQPPYTYTPTPPHSQHELHQLARPSRSVSFANLQELPDELHYIAHRRTPSPAPSPATSSLGPLKYYRP